MRLIGPVLLIACLSVLFTASCKNDKAEVKKGDNELSTEINTLDTTEIKASKVILFYGNSLTAGYGLDPEESFPSLIEDTLLSLGFKYQVVNAGLSGETTSGGLKRIDWVLNQKVDIFVLELGANDMLRGLPLDETKKNLAEILKSVRQKYPKAQLALCEMMAPPNMGKLYVDEFQSIYSDLAKEYGATLIPFFLNGVAGNPGLILPDGKHPNAEGQKVVAQNIWKSIKGMLD